MTNRRSILIPCHGLQLPVKEAALLQSAAGRNNCPALTELSVAARRRRRHIEGQNSDSTQYALESRRPIPDTPDTAIKIAHASAHYRFRFWDLLLVPVPQWRLHGIGSRHSQRPELGATIALCSWVYDNIQRSSRRRATMQDPPQCIFR